VRTLKEIDEQILADSKEVIQQLNEAEDGPLMIPEGDALWLQTESRFNEKYREMYGILEDVENYFRCLDAGETRDVDIIRKNIETALKKL